jgi:hypothetical protein
VVRNWAIVGVGLLVLSVVGTCVLAAVMLGPMLRAGSSVTSEWRATLAHDYPGWQVVGFSVSSYSSADGSITDYAFLLRPPGRDFTVGVAYEGLGTRPARSHDEVLRVGGTDHDRAAPLLDIIKARYVDKGYEIADVESLDSGSMRLWWRKGGSFGPFRWSDSGYDDLTYVIENGEWVIYESSI